MTSAPSQGPPPPSRSGTGQELRELLQLPLVRSFAFTALMATVGALCFITKYGVSDLDIWWHLKVGDWIVERRAVPHTGIFSQTAGNHPWTAYSWGYEVLLSRAYAWFGLLGVELFGVALTLAVAGVLFWMLHRLSHRFWVAWTVCTVACSAFLFNLMPRPVFFSMVLFAITLTLILEAQRSGRLHLLYWLPPIFFLWANLHIQFIYGLFLAGLLLGVNLLLKLGGFLGVDSSFFVEAKLPILGLAGIFIVCLLATGLGPYGFHLYQVVFEYSRARVPYTMIIELQALAFNSFTHYVELLLAAAAFFAVGWQKKLDLFKLLLLMVAAIVAFRTIRDGWFICISAAVCIADCPAEEAKSPTSRRAVEFAGVTILLALVLVLVARNADFSSRGLNRAISSQFPVDAANFLRRQPMPGPLYNSFDWGGFLIWYMPQYPVAIDGRNDLYGDELDARFYKTESADASYKEDPFLNQAGVVLLKQNVPLAGMLALDSRFRLIYRDKIAVIFVRQ